MIHANASTPITLKHSAFHKRKKQIHCKTPPPLLEPATKPYKSKFTASLEYFTKLYEESTKQSLNNNLCVRSVIGVLAAVVACSNIVRESVVRYLVLGAEASYWRLCPV